MLHLETIEPRTLQLLKSLQAIPALKDTRLVGGTSLALQLGHRNSVDLDLFGSITISADELRETIASNHSVTIVNESKNINIYLIDGIKVDVVNYQYNWLDEPIQESPVTLAGIRDIAAMKIAAVIGRGTKKDFVDLFFLLKHFSLQQILDLYMEKYPDGSVFIAMKSLTYFDDAESDPMPKMFEDVSWETVKNSIRKAVSQL